MRFKTKKVHWFIPSVFDTEKEQCEKEQETAGTQKEKLVPHIKLQSKKKILCPHVDFSQLFEAVRLTPSSETIQDSLVTIMIITMPLIADCSGHWVSIDQWPGAISRKSPLHAAQLIIPMRIRNMMMRIINLTYLNLYIYQATINPPTMPMMCQ